MQLWSGRRRLPLVMVALLVAVIAPLSTAAQEEIVVTVAVPQFFSNMLTPELLEAFSAENPGVSVQVVDAGFANFASPTDGLEAHLSAVNDYASMADVVFAESSNFSVEATRAGYFLDLTPLTSADPTLNIDDFIPAAWQSVQWDNGVWALPVSVDVVTLVYNAAKFDEAGVAYPDPSWSIEELANAARQLAEYDANNTVSTPGLVMFGNYAPLLARSLMRTSFIDNSVVPDMPDFSSPELASILTTLSELEVEGVISSSFSGNIDDAPMRIIGSFGLTSFDPNTPASPSVALPGGSAGLDVQGFAISSGTRYPEAAYALAKFLTTRPEIASNFFGAAPARESLRGVQPETGGGPGGGGAIAVQRFNNPEVEAAVNAALEVALPISELRFGNYVNTALSSMNSDGVDAATALQDAESLAVSNLTEAANLRPDTAVVVATPVPEVVLAEGEISLKFGLQSFISPLPNQDQWNQVISDFVASDPQVGDIELVTGFNTDPAESDCYYLPYNNVPEVDLNTVLSLDPYLDADPTFDRNDFAGSVMTQVQRDNKTWALPLVIQPEALRYNSELFEQAGVPLPENGWTVDSFVDALRQLKDYTGEVPFGSQGFGGTYVLLLVAAYGGLPVDYRTSPPTLNFTDPATVEAIRQVLDLAKEGLLDYQELAADGGAIFIAAAGAEDERPPIYTQAQIGPGDISVLIGGEQRVDPYKTTTYPLGTSFNAITYGVGTAYINAATQNADACYRWLSTISQHMELFTGMPARLSMLDDPSRSADEVSFYNQIASLLSDPNTIEFPSAFRGASPAAFLQLRWLEQVFDAYVLEDADLETELADAQVISQTFQECVAGIPAFDPATEDQRGYFQQFGQCARLADPNMGSLFGG